MFGVRTAVRTTLVPMASNRHANRAPGLASQSTTSTSGWMSSVVLRACCAHQSSDGARVTAACMILRLFRSRKNRTKIGRKSRSKVCTNSQAQVTWLHCTVRFETRIPSLSNSPRSRSAPHLGFAPPSRGSASRGVSAFGREPVTAIATEGARLRPPTRWPPRGAILRTWVSKGWPHGQALRERENGPAWPAWR